MNILVITHEYPPIGGGGGHVAQDTCQELAARGHNMTVLTTGYRGLPKQETIDGVYIVRVPALRKEKFRASFLSMALFLVFGLFYGYRIVRQRTPDFIHAHFAVPGGALAWWLSKLFGIPYGITAHLGDVPGGAPKKTDKWFRWVLPFTQPVWRDAKKVIAVSEFTRQLARKQYPVDITVIHNGIDLKKKPSGETRIQKPPQIIFAGRFMPQKNPVQIVKTLATLKTLPWNCVLLGNGPLRESVEQEVTSHYLQDRITFPGWVTSEEVLAWFSKSDILFMPSLSEGFPVVGVQALAMGLALVVSNVGGFIDLIDQGENGFLVPLIETEKFSKSLKLLLTDQDLLLQFKKRSLLKAKTFDLPYIVDRYLQEFLDVINA